MLKQYGTAFYFKNMCLIFFMFIVIHAWANSSEKHGIERAHNLLLEMKKLRDSRARPDLVPDQIAFTSIISALAQSAGRRDPAETQKVMDTMLDFVNDNEGDIQLDTPAYNALIHAQSKQKGSVAIAEQLLNHMLEQDTNIRPVSFVFHDFNIRFVFLNNVILFKCTL